ncbi:MAG: hypothetical protein QNL01_00940 [Akkermansiaceae bacterium]
MRSNHQNYAPTPGRVDGPSLLYGGIGLALAVAMQLVGLFKMGDARLKQSLLGSVFHGATPDVLAMPVLVIVAAIFCFGLAFAVLDSEATWRRVILGITALVIVFAMVPTLAVWNIYFSPFLPAIALFWTWFCTMMYVNHHVMPCEHHDPDFEVTTVMHDVAAKPVRAEKAEIVKEELKKEPHKSKPIDPEAKYKPKQQK